METRRLLEAVCNSEAQSLVTGALSIDLRYICFIKGTQRVKDPPACSA